MERHRILAAMSALLIVACDRKQSSKGVGGEPESQIILRSKDGKVLTSGDLKTAEGQFDYEVLGTTQIPEQARRLHQEARQLGSAGKYEDALKRLAEAHTLAPSWPYPPYDSAFTYLLMKDFVKARESYEQTVKLSPRGFFTAITAFDTLNREASGGLPEGTYAAYVTLEWIDDPEQKARMVQGFVERFPNFAPAWKEYAVLCDSPEEKLAALEKGLAARPDKETEGILLINKALALNEQGDKDAASEILGAVALDGASTLGNEHLAKQSLAMIHNQNR